MYELFVKAGQSPQSLRVLQYLLSILDRLKTSVHVNVLDDGDINDAQTVQRLQGNGIQGLPALWSQEGVTHKGDAIIQHLDRLTAVSIPAPVGKQKRARRHDVESAQKAILEQIDEEAGEDETGKKRNLRDTEASSRISDALQRRSEQTGQPSVADKLRHTAAKSAPRPITRNSTQLQAPMPPPGKRGGDDEGPGRTSGSNMLNKLRQQGSTGGGGNNGERMANLAVVSDDELEEEDPVDSILRSISKTPDD